MNAKLMIVVVLILSMMSGCVAGPLTALGKSAGSSSDSFSFSAQTTGGGRANFEMYVMSQCPFGVQAENAIIPVVEKFGDALKFKIDFIADETQEGFRALHGQPEVEGNIAQLCGEKYNQDKYLKLIMCMNEDSRAIPGNWKQCAENLGMDVVKMQSCFEGSEGADLLRESIKRTNKAGARASPTIFLNGQAYNGGRDPLDFHRAICGALNGDHPACRDIPVCASDADCTAEPDKEGSCENANQKEAGCVYKDPVPVSMQILNSKECKTCDTSAIEGQIKQMFKGLSVKTIDVSDVEGKKLVAKLNAQVVPVYIFDKNIAKTKSWAQNQNLQGAFDEIPEGFVLKNAVVGSRFFIDESSRTQYYQDIGVTKGDNRPQVDFFVMSYCPFGNQAEEAMKGAFDKLKGKADFNPKWVVYSNYGDGGPSFCLGDGKYCSMHGVQELNQDLREACVHQLFGEQKFFDFALAMNNQCSAQNADSCWKDVAAGLTIDVAKVQACYDTKNIEISRQNKELGDKLGVQGSPTVFIDGEEYNGPRTAEGYLASLCAAFDQKPAECAGVPEPSQVAAAPQPAAALGGGCGA